MKVALVVAILITSQLVSVPPTLGSLKKDDKQYISIWGILKEDPTDQGGQKFNTRFRWFWLSCMGRVCNWNHLVVPQCSGIDKSASLVSWLGDFPVPPAALHEKEPGKSEWIEISKSDERHLKVKRRNNTGLDEDMFNYDLEVDCNKKGFANACLIKSMKGTTRFSAENGGELLYKSELYEDMSGVDGTLRNCSKK